MNDLDQVFQMAKESEHPTRFSFGQFVNVGLGLLDDPKCISDKNRLEFRLILEALREGKKIIFAYVDKTENNLERNEND